MSSSLPATLPVLPAREIHTINVKKQYFNEIETTKETALFFHKKQLSGVFMPPSLWNAIADKPRNLVISLHPLAHLTEKSWKYSNDLNRHEHHPALTKFLKHPHYVYVLLCGKEIVGYLISTSVYENLRQRYSA